MLWLGMRKKGGKAVQDSQKDFRKRYKSEPRFDTSLQLQLHGKKFRSWRSASGSSVSWPTASPCSSGPVGASSAPSGGSCPPPSALTLPWTCPLATGWDPWASGLCRAPGTSGSSTSGRWSYSTDAGQSKKGFNYFFYTFIYVKLVRVFLAVSMYYTLYSLSWALLFAVVSTKYSCKV